MVQPPITVNYAYATPARTRTSMRQRETERERRRERDGAMLCYSDNFFCLLYVYSMFFCSVFLEYVCVYVCVFCVCMCRWRVDTGGFRECPDDLLWDEKELLEKHITF